MRKNVFALIAIIFIWPLTVSAASDSAGKPPASSGAHKSPANGDEAGIRREADIRTTEPVPRPGKPMVDVEIPGFPPPDKRPLFAPPPRTRELGPQ